MAAKQRPRTRGSIARNLRLLIDHAHWTQRDLETRSGVSQRQISNILTQTTSCSTETADALAKPFGLEGWHLLIPNLPLDLVHSPSIAKLVAAYIRAGQDTRDFIDSVAEREATYRPDK